MSVGGSDSDSGSGSGSGSRGPLQPLTGDAFSAALPSFTYTVNRTSRQPVFAIRSSRFFTSLSLNFWNVSPVVGSLQLRLTARNCS